MTKRDFVSIKHRGVQIADQNRLGPSGPRDGDLGELGSLFPINPETEEWTAEALQRYPLHDLGDTFVRAEDVKRESIGRLMNPFDPVE